MHLQAGKTYTYLWGLLALLSPKNRIKLLSVGLIQFSLSMLDLLGLLTIGAVTSLAYSAVNSTPLPISLEFVLKIPYLENQGLEKVTIFFSIFAVFVLLSKTILSAVLVRRIIGFLSIREAEISSFYFSELLRSSPGALKKRSPQQVSGVAISAVNAGVTVTLGQLTTLIVEVFSVVLIFIGISFVDLTVTIPSLLFFVLLALVSIRVLKDRVARSSAQSYFLGITSTELIRNALATSRDIFLSNKQNQISNEYRYMRLQNYKATRSAAFSSSLPKFISEIGLITGGAIVATIQIVLKDARGVLVGLVLFLALSSRMIPSLLRIQNAVLEINGAREASKDLLRELNELSASKHLNSNDLGQANLLNTELVKFSPEILLRDGNMKHSSVDTFQMTDLSLTVSQGQFVGVVGPSGGGKTTLVDILSGVLELEQGEIFIGGLHPKQAINVWPTQIRYVPQDVHLVVGTLRMNITWPDLESKITDAEIWELLRIVGLEQWVRGLPDGLNSSVENFGSNISGGQKQRIGIARALSTKPQLIFFDEATSSLDSVTEQYIAESVIEKLGGITRVVVAHRLSTVVNADKIFYVASGKIVASGTFSEIRRLVPEFEQQAIASGL